MTKLQSYIEYNIGTLMYDENTGEVFEVIKCSRIRISSELPCFGITVKEVKNVI
jgi:hypothetical protein